MNPLINQLVTQNKENFGYSGNLLAKASFKMIETYKDDLIEKIINELIYGILNYFIFFFY